MPSKISKLAVQGQRFNTRLKAFGAPPGNKNAAGPHDRRKSGKASAVLKSIIEGVDQLSPAHRTLLKSLLDGRRGDRRKSKIAKLALQGQDFKTQVAKFGAPPGNKNAAGPHDRRKSGGVDLRREKMKAERRKDKPGRMLGGKDQGWMWTLPDPLKMSRATHKKIHTNRVVGCV